MCFSRYTYDDYRFVQSPRAAQNCFAGHIQPAGHKFETPDVDRHTVTCDKYNKEKPQGFGREDVHMKE